MPLISLSSIKGLSRRCGFLSDYLLLSQDRAEHPQEST